MAKASEALLTLSSDTKAISDPILEKANISFFKYVNVSFKSNKITYLSNDVKWLTHYFDQTYYNISTFNRNLPDEMVLLWNQIVGSATKIQQDAAINFNINHGLTLAINCQDGTEYFLFGTTNDHPNMTAFLMNNIDWLKTFVYYFKDKSRKLIEDAFQHAIQPRSALISKTAKIQPIEQNGLVELGGMVDRYYLDSRKKLYITRRELESLKWCAFGKSYEETALIMGISPRTVETHIENLKRKLDCVKTTQLIYHACKLGLI